MLQSCLIHRNVAKVRVANRNARQYTRNVEGWASLVVNRVTGKRTADLV